MGVAVPTGIKGEKQVIVGGSGACTPQKIYMLRDHFWCVAP